MVHIVLVCLQGARSQQYSMMLQQQRRDKVASDPVMQQVSNRGVS